MIGNRQCASCEIGAAHARGEVPTTWADGSLIAVTQLTAGGSRLTMATSDPAPPIEEKTMGRYNDRKCAKCEKTFSPSGARQLYCGDECRAAARAATETPVEVDVPVRRKKTAIRKLPKLRSGARVSAPRRIESVDQAEVSTEIAAIGTCWNAIRGLDGAARARVLNYVSDRAGLAGVAGLDS